MLLKSQAPAFCSIQSCVPPIVKQPQKAHNCDRQTIRNCHLEIYTPSPSFSCDSAMQTESKHNVKSFLEHLHSYPRISHAKRIDPAPIPSNPKKHPKSLTQSDMRSHSSFVLLRHVFTAHKLLGTPWSATWLSHARQNPEPKQLLFAQSTGYRDRIPWAASFLFGR